MIKFENVEYDKAKMSTLDLFVGAVSYESRSSFIFDQIHNDLGNEKMMIFCTDNYTVLKMATSLVRHAEELGCQVRKVGYEDSETVVNAVCESIEALTKSSSVITIGIDYSSMPRSWYCRLPYAIAAIVRPEDKVVFWYAEGEYETKPTEYPTAGLDMFELFSGKASLLAKRRAHIFALGYDAVRTQGIISKLEPEYVIVCAAYDPTRKDVYDNVRDANQAVINQAALAITLDISDFSFMVTKLRELVNELSAISDVVLIPDGPKPLILAMSLIPRLCGKSGITCLHANRNRATFVPVEVTPTGKVVGFQMKIGDQENSTAIRNQSV